MGAGMVNHVWRSLQYCCTYTCVKAGCDQSIHSSRYQSQCGSCGGSGRVTVVTPSRTVGRMMIPSSRIQSSCSTCGGQGQTSQLVYCGVYYCLEHCTEMHCNMKPRDPDD